MSWDKVATINIQSWCELVPRGSSDSPLATENGGRVQKPVDVTGVGVLRQQEENMKGKSPATEFLFTSLINDLSGTSLLETS